jgi:hypothetical protein
MHMLKSSDDFVHFLYFWRAFSEATRYIAGTAGQSDDDLLVEMETVRDKILSLLEVQKRSEGALTLPAGTLVQVIRNTAAMSATPNFWLSVAEQCRRQCSPASWSAWENVSIGMEEMTVMMLTWLHDAAAIWQENRPTRSSSVDDVVDSQSSGMQVSLHVYDVSHESKIRRFNKVFAHRYSPLKFGGVFHVGVEVNGAEWSYAFTPEESIPAVSCCLPRSDTQHNFRQTVKMYRTQMSAAEISQLVADMMKEYKGPEYDLLRRNCCHFADDLCQRIGSGAIPRWVHRLARVGAQVEKALAGLRKPACDESEEARHLLQVAEEQKQALERTVLTSRGGGRQKPQGRFASWR